MKFNPVILNQGVIILKYLIKTEYLMDERQIINKLTEMLEPKGCGIL